MQELHFETHGDRSNPAVFMGPHFYASRKAGDASHTDTWIDGLKRRFFLIVADYPRGVGRTAFDGTACTPTQVVQDIEYLADAAGVGRFAWLGYSFGGAVGVQLACRTNRVSALAIGGFPPLRSPYRHIINMAVDMASGDPASCAESDRILLQATVDFYTPLLDWPEDAEVARLDMPRLVFMGEQDGVGESDRAAPLAACLRSAEARLRNLGWRVAWLPGHDHLSALRPEVSLHLVERFLCGALRPGGT